MKNIFRLGITTLLAAFAQIVPAGAAGLEISESGDAPGKKIAIVSPGLYKAVIWQASGGGINEFYNLASDADAKQNLAWSSHGLFEVGWHGNTFKGPDREDCCNKHIENKKRMVKDAKTGEMVRDICNDGTADWPSMGHKDLKVSGELAIIEQSPARVRVRAQAPFVWWSKLIHKLEATAIYTFYPSGRIVVQMRVQNPGERPFHWSSEYGPHIAVVGWNKKPDDKNQAFDPGFVWSTPKQDIFKSGSPAEELVLARSDATRTSLMISIPVEASELFPRTMQHNGRGIGWDRAGYGSSGIVMEKGYDSAWACVIQMGAENSALAPELKTAKDALPCSMQYRAPAKISGAELVTGDPGDFNKDGFNESEGCHVLKGPGPLSFTYERGAGGGFAPAFKVTGWKGTAPRKIKVDGKDVPAVSAVVDGNLILQITGTLEGEKAKIEIGG